VPRVFRKVLFQQQPCLEFKLVHQLTHRWPNVPIDGFSYSSYPSFGKG